MTNGADGSEREILETDLLFVGAGPATLACAIRVAERCAERGLAPPSMLVIEKASEVGGHQLSGAVVDPIALASLVPDYMDEGFPLEHRVDHEAVYFLTRKRALRVPTPPAMRNHGNLVVSNSKLVAWLAERAESRGIEIYPGFAAAEPLIAGGRVLGVRLQDAGLDRDGHPKATWEAGAEIRARCTIFGEGSRGSCTKIVQDFFGLHGESPQVYETGVKEIWRVSPEKHRPGRVLHTLGYPFDSGTFGGTWLYDMADGLVSVGTVTGLNYENPFTDPHDNLQRFKLHPKIRAILEGGECVKYGARTLPAGGLFSMPKGFVDGAVFVGDSAGFCNGQRLKGIHQALESGMLAAEAVVDGVAADDFGEDTLSVYRAGFEQSWAYREHRRSRNWHASFSWVQALPRWLGWLRQGPWIANGVGLALVTGGRGLVDHVAHRPDWQHMKRLDRMRPRELARVTARAQDKVAYDNRYTFDKVTAVALSGAAHEVDQPSHLQIADASLCVSRCAEEYGNPCEHFCPAAVYEMVDDPQAEGGRAIHVHAENCVHCKTCDVVDPYQQITWVTPEGGDGPDYRGM